MSNDKQIKALALTEEARAVKDIFDRLAMYTVKGTDGKLHPLPKLVRYATARMAVAYGLDPFLGELQVIQTRQGLVPYVGIDGMRRVARQSGVYGGRNFVPLEDWERDLYGLKDEDLALKCIVARTDCSQVFDGIGVVGPSHKYQGTAPAFKMVRIRAERAALRAAFDLHFEGLENGEPGSDVPEWVDAEDSVEADFVRIDPYTPEEREREENKSVAEHIEDLFGEQPQNNGRASKSRGVLPIKTALFHSVVLPAIAFQTDYYNRNGQIDPWHVIGALKKRGWVEINDDNAEEAIDEAVLYAKEQREGRSDNVSA
jgi:hypothetical protein